MLGIIDDFDGTLDMLRDSQSKNKFESIDRSKYVCTHTFSGEPCWCLQTRCVWKDKNKQIEDCPFLKK